MKILERQWDKVMMEPNTGCWLWAGGLCTKGYGQTKHNGKSHLAHRLFYQAHKGEIPAGYHIDHLCRVRSCVNPDHLEAVTCAENNRRSLPFHPVKTECAQGHLYTDDSTGRNRFGHRFCRVCRQIYDRKRYQIRTRPLRRV